MTQGNDGWAIGGGGNSFPFDNIGDYVQGTVFEFEPGLPQTHITGPLKGQARFYTSGAPMLMDRVGLHVTASSNPAVAVGSDASIYLKGGLKPFEGGSYSTQGAVLAAIKETTGHNRLQPGAKLTLQYVADIPPKEKGSGEAKGYKAWYEAPSLQVGGPDPTLGASANPATGTAPQAGVSPPMPPVGAPGAATTAPQAAPPVTPPVAPGPPATTPPGAATTAVPEPAVPGLTPEQMAQLAALQAAQAPLVPPAWDDDPRVGPLRAQGVADAVIRQVLGI